MVTPLEVSAVNTSVCWLLTYRVSVVAVLSLALIAVSQAVTVHTWIDSDGVRHFADKPPTDQSASSEISVAEGAPVAGAAADYYSIGNQWQRLRAEREAQAATELERERLELERGEQAAAPPPAYTPTRSPLYRPYYGSPPLYPWPDPMMGEERGPPSSRNAFVNKAPPLWPRQR